MISSILAYHELYNNKEEEEYCAMAMGPSCSTSRCNFEKQLEVIINSRVSTVTFANLFEFMSPLKQGTCPLILTFDDGHIGNYRYAYPLLKKKNMSAVFFVTTNLIESDKMMDWVQLREMADNGMSVQSHGVSHEPLETLSSSRVAVELGESKKIIEDKIGQEVDTISLPHGSMHKETVELAAKIGYRFVCTSIIDYFTFFDKSSVMVAPRIPVYSNMSSSMFGDIITADCKDVYRWKRIQKIKYLIKNLVGINYYRKIYRLVHGITIR